MAIISISNNFDGLLNLNYSIRQTNLIEWNIAFQWSRDEHLVVSMCISHVLVCVFTWTNEYLFIPKGKKRAQSKRIFGHEKFPHFGRMSKLECTRAKKSSAKILPYAIKEFSAGISCNVYTCVWHSTVEHWLKEKKTVFFSNG